MDANLQDTLTTVGPVKPLLKRRKYSKAQKRHMVEECLAGGDSVSVIARRHDVNANLLFKWRRQYDEGALKDEPATAALVPIVVEQSGPALPPVPKGSSPSTRSDNGNLDIFLAGGHRLVVAGTVCPVALRTALEVLSA